MEDHSATRTSPPEPPPIHRLNVPRRPAWRRWAVQRGVELVTVFVGVYAAFLLNAYQQRRQEQARRVQLLDWLDSVYKEQITSLKSEAVHVRQQADDFNRQLEAGEMPALHAFNWQSDYDPADIPGLLQSGGYDLLEVDTVRAIKEADDTLRRMVMVLRHDQQLSDTLVLPNLGKGPEIFYDPNTRRLRETYRWYKGFFEAVTTSYGELQPEVENVLKRLRAERARNR